METVKIEYDRQGSGVPVILLHGYCGSRRYWADAIPALARRCDVIAPDLRGHGASPATEGIYAMETLAADTAALMDRLGLPRAFLFGHSLGGYAALAFAERYPDRLLGFGLIHSTSLPDTESGRDGRLQAVRTVQDQGVRPFVDGLIPKLFAADNRTRRADKVAEAIEIGYGTSPSGAVGCALGMRERPDRTDVLRAAALPVLQLAGEQDEVVPPERRFPAASPRIRAVTLPGVGHMSMLEQPRLLADALLDFITACGTVAP